MSSGSPAPSPNPPKSLPLFDGVTFEPRFDLQRLGVQLRRVVVLMADGHWRTLREISDAVGAPEASCSARLRDCRKQKFLGATVDRRRRGDPKRGVFEYRLTLSDPDERNAP